MNRAPIAFFTYKRPLHTLKSLESLANNQGADRSELFIFSDDLDWCKHNLKFDASIHFVDVNQQQNFHLDLHLMSHCKSNVIANSSFSWWAAWLNQNRDKTIIAPKQWYANNAMSTKDLIPGTWIQL